MTASGSVPGSGARAWKDCPSCRGTGWSAVSLKQVDEKVFSFGRARDGESPCPTCAAHFSALDAARAEGVAQERGRCLTAVACSLNPAAMSCDALWAQGVTDGQRAAIAAIRGGDKGVTNGK